MPKRCTIPTTELAMRAVLHVQAMRKSMLIGDVADTLRAQFDLSRAHAYRVTAMALDVLGRQARPRPAQSCRDYAPLSTEHRARIGESMRRRWREDPAYAKRLRKTRRELVLRGSRVNR